MSVRKITFVNDGYYHVFNRGVDKRVVFTDRDELNFFLNRLSDLNSVDTSNALKSKRYRLKGELALADTEKLVSIVAYCVLPNHFHLLLKQKTDDGISKFMQRLGTSYVHFFNKKHQRLGSLFQGKFKATALNGDYALAKVASYVNLNFKHHRIDPKKNIVKSSMAEYIALNVENPICDSQEISNIIDEVGGVSQYKEMAKSASIVFASNKSTSLSEKDFEF